MKKALCLSLSFVLLAVCTAFVAPVSFAVSGTSYYFDSRRGSDENAGTSSAAPWKSTSKLGEVTLQPGDSVLFKRGERFDCTLSFTCSGTEESPIVISSYGDETPEPALLTTSQRADVLKLIDCCYVTVSDLEITAHSGGGIWVDTFGKTSVGITLDNLSIHDIQNFKVNSRDDLSNGAVGARACLMVKGLPAHSRFAVNDLTVKNCEMFDCGNGISLWGSWNDEQKPWCETEEEIDPIYNTGVLVENVFFHDMDAEAIIVGMCDGAVITGCTSLNCCQGVGTDENGVTLYYTAAMWFWGSENSTIEHCEIAGQKNFGDGMAVDFDSHSNNCTYQYIYSHDNTRFMCNCPNYSGHHGNTVRYCLSVNDNRGRSRMAGDCGEYGFGFYNNTIVNCGEFQMMDIYDAKVVNNIIIPADGCIVACNPTEIKHNNIYSNNCYYNCLTPVVDPFALNTVPGFSGKNYDKADSFMLSSASPLIGAGCDNGSGLTHDFYDNPIVSNNIGCYAGSGTDAAYSRETIIAKLIRMICLLFSTLRHEMSIIAGNISDWFRDLKK